MGTSLIAVEEFVDDQASGRIAGDSEEVDKPAKAPCGPHGADWRVQMETCTTFVFFVRWLSPKVRGNSFGVVEGVLILLLHDCILLHDRRNPGSWVESRKERHTQRACSLRPSAGWDVNGRSILFRQMLPK